ncbi:hypothetical protein [Streptomyces sp. SID5910]|uniref:hypothetical protein n=1 Tax=Streptomyces sp. SID5910 TaxID=2690312 RepID=UPI0013721592|nr:hypothetical protein [Streptomyces sp. SID5910]MYR45071.1 hypothetical protein [Streptomyces sp. SID5910]
MSAPTTMQWIRQAGQRICTGSGRLAALLTARAVHAARRLWQRAEAWAGEPFTFGWLLRLAVLLGAAVVLRKIAAAVGGGLYAAVADGRAPWLMWGTAGLWVLAAYRCGQDGWAPGRTAGPPAGGEQQAGEEQSADSEVVDEPVEQPSAGPWLPTLIDLRVALRATGTPHAHLAVLAAHIGTTPERVREALERWEIPVEAVRMRGRGTSTGVKGGDAAHPALAYDPDEGDVVAAGQPGSNSNSNADEDDLREGIDVRRTDGGLIIYDLADRHRRRGTVGH